VKAFRNETLISKTDYPAVVLLDGEELADDNDPAGRPALTKRRVTMTPEVQFRLGDTAELVGTRLNALRLKANDAVMADATLLALTLDGNSARYLGSRTVTERGEKVEGAIGCGFAFTYVLKPAALRGGVDPREAILARLLAIVGGISE
jgi:hypothetical protein